MTAPITDAARHEPLICLGTHRCACVCDHCWANHDDKWGWL